ncbi:MAG: hypothetical protein AAGK79_05735 [Pseudomonadota bacterium]
MSFVRPEARAALWRWREALAAASVFVFGVWWAISGAALTRGLGVVVALAALAFFAAGVQRGRFRGPAGGVGVLRVDEGQIAYFGPLSGGIVALSELSQLAYDATGKPAHWVLRQIGQEDLCIPVDAEGADALFDVFTSLPGLRTEDILRVQNMPGNTITVIWRRKGNLSRALPRQL